MLHTGAAEALGRLRLLEADHLGPGEEGWAQVRLETPIAALRGDRVVLRVPSPAATVAGGVIVAVNPRRHNRRSPAVRRRLEEMAVATPEERLLDALAGEPATAADLVTRADLQLEEVGRGVAALASSGLARPLTAGAARPGAYWAASAWLDGVERRALAALQEYHARYPLRRGMAGEALREALGIERRPWADLLEGWRAGDVVAGAGDLLWEPGHAVVLDARQERAATALLAKLAEHPYTPPSLGEIDAVAPELLASLLERGDPVRVAEGILLRRAAYEEMRDTALSLIDAQGQVTVGMLRDTFATSRKFALALLEHLDDLRLTRRLGDARVRGSAALLAGG